MLDKSRRYQTKAEDIRQKQMISDKNRRYQTTADDIRQKQTISDKTDDI